MILRAFIGLFALTLVVAPALADVPSRLSAAVAFQTEGALNRFWLDNPSYGYVEAYFRIPADLADDVIFGVDQEWLDGTDDPYFGIPGGDWMGIVGLQRSGKVWVAAGTDETMDGEPSEERNWQVLPLGAEILPDEWYSILVLVDFSQRRYASVSVVGPNIDSTIDLSAYALDYPNYAAFDGRAMTHYVFSMRGEHLAADPDQSAKVFFDDLSAGYIYGTTWYPALEDSFEESPIAIPQLPFHFIFGEPASLSDVSDATWYLEREEALVMTVHDRNKGFARSGTKFIVCDADLNETDYFWWVFWDNIRWRWLFSLLP